MNIGGHEIRKVTRDKAPYAMVPVTVEISLGQHGTVTVSTELEIPWEELQEAKQEYETTWEDFDIDGWLQEDIQPELESIGVDT
jgi:hypothetical protein